MRTSCRIGIASALAIASLLAPISLAGPEPAHTITVAAGGGPLAWKDARGRYLALHFLAKTDTPECAAFVREYFRSAPSVAGVRHVFIKADDAEWVRAWSAQFTDEGRAIYVDKDGGLAAELKVPGGLAIGGTTSNYPATVVLDPAGQEILRYTGKAHHDHLAFADFARQMAVKTRPAALADYNLPSEKPLAVDGYDPVAYFKQNRAVKGRPELASQYRGITYRFATEEDRGIFAADPERYLPTYGGWCASAMGAKGTKVEIDPTNFKVKDGRLFLFYKSLLGDALKDWNKHERVWEPAADANWKKLTGEAASKPAE